MARIRTIKPEFWTSEQVTECSPIARLLFIGLWNFCDDAGRHTLSAKTIKAEVFPTDDLSTDAVRGMIDELSHAQLVRLYTIESKEYLQVTGWQHQRIDKPQKARHPPPLRERSSNDSRTFDALEEGKGREWKETENNSKLSNSEPRARELAGWLRVQIIQAFEAANNPNPPDTSRAEVWLAQGYDAEVCAAVIRDVLGKNPKVRGLNYFDGAIRDAHSERPTAGSGAAARARLKVVETEPDWEFMARCWAESRGSDWPIYAGPAPGRGGCRCPPEHLRRHNINPETGSPEDQSWVA